MPLTDRVSSRQLARLTIGVHKLANDVSFRCGQHAPTTIDSTPETQARDRSALSKTSQRSIVNIKRCHMFPPEDLLDSPITRCRSGMLEEVGRHVIGSSIEERFVHALRQACDDPDDQESPVVYGIATRRSFAAPACLSGASSLSNRSRIGQYLEQWNAWTFSEFAVLAALGDGCPMTYGDSR